MAVSRNRAWEYAEELLSVPRGSVPITLRHGKSGVVLLHKGRVVTRCYSSKVGQWCAPLVAQALGLKMPAPGESVTTSVSTGVLFRAVSIAALDLRKAATHPILERMLEEAELQRSRGGSG